MSTRVKFEVPVSAAKSGFYSEYDGTTKPAKVRVWINGKLVPNPQDYLKVGK